MGPYRKMGHDFYNNSLRTSTSNSTVAINMNMGPQNENEVVGEIDFKEV